MFMHMQVDAGNGYSSDASHLQPSSLSFYQVLGLYTYIYMYSTSSVANVYICIMYEQSMNHISLKNRPRCYVKSPTAQDAVSYSSSKSASIFFFSSCLILGFSHLSLCWSHLELWQERSLCSGMQTIAAAGRLRHGLQQIRCMAYIEYT